MHSARCLLAVMDTASNGSRLFDDAVVKMHGQAPPPPHIQHPRYYSTSLLCGLTRLTSDGSVPFARIHRAAGTRHQQRRRQLRLSRPIKAVHPGFERFVLAGPQCPRFAVAVAACCLLTFGSANLSTLSLLPAMPTHPNGQPRPGRHRVACYRCDPAEHAVPGSHCRDSSRLRCPCSMHVALVMTSSSSSSTTRPLSTSKLLLLNGQRRRKERGQRAFGTKHRRTQLP